MIPSAPREVPRLLLLGGSGQLGRSVQSGAPDGWAIDAPSSQMLSLTEPASVRDYLERTRPTAVLNCAAYTRVDDAEANVALATALNATAPGCLAESAGAVNAYFVHVSTDYVFDGAGPSPYAPDAETHPLNVYGHTKLAGEHAVLAAHPGAAIVRTAWLHSATHGNFIETAVRLLSTGRSMRVVDDQVGTPTAAAHLAAVLWAMLERRDLRGVHHMTDAGVASWFDVAAYVRQLLQDARLLPDGTEVTPVRSTEYPRAARRPAVSILSTYHTRRALDWTPTDWRTGVRATCATLLTGMQRGSVVG